MNNIFDISSLKRARREFVETVLTGRDLDPATGRTISDSDLGGAALGENVIYVDFGFQDPDQGPIAG